MKPVENIEDVLELLQKVMDTDGPVQINLAQLLLILAKEIKVTQEDIRFLLVQTSQVDD